MITSTEQQGSNSTTNYTSQLFATTGQLSYCDQHFLLISTRNGSIARINSKSLQGLTLALSLEAESSMLILKEMHRHSLSSMYIEPSAFVCSAGL